MSHKIYRRIVAPSHHKVRTVMFTFYKSIVLGIAAGLVLTWIIPVIEIAVYFLFYLCGRIGYGLFEVGTLGGIAGGFIGSILSSAFLKQKSKAAQDWLIFLMAIIGAIIVLCIFTYPTFLHTCTVSL